MEAFEYARPKSTQEAIKLLTGTEGRALALAGGTDLISLMKDGVAKPQAPGQLATRQRTQGNFLPGRVRAAPGRRRDLGRVDGERRSPRALSRPGAGGGGRPQPASPQHGNGGRRPLPAPALLVLSRRVWIAGGLQGQTAGSGWRQPLPRHPGKFRARLFRQPVQPGAHPDCAWTPR